MNKTHYLALLAALILFLGLYLGFDTKPSRQLMVERSRALQEESTGLETLLTEARAGLTTQQSATIAEQERELEQSTDDQQRIGRLKRLSGTWYDFGQLPAAGGLAEQAAELENSDSAWSVAGATYYQALVRAEGPVIRAFCAQHAVKAFESAASLNPDNPEHRVNLALVYAEQPSAENPMQAVQMLRELETKYPDEPAVFNALGRLAIKTGQWDRAIQRLEKRSPSTRPIPIRPVCWPRPMKAPARPTKRRNFLKNALNKQYFITHIRSLYALRKKT